METKRELISDVDKKIKEKIDKLLKEMDTLDIKTKSYSIMNLSGAIKNLKDSLRG